MKLDRCGNNWYKVTCHSMDARQVYIWCRDHESTGKFAYYLIDYNAVLYFESKEDFTLFALTWMD